MVVGTLLTAERAHGCLQGLENLFLCPTRVVSIRLRTVRHLNPLRSRLPAEMCQKEGESYARDASGGQVPLGSDEAVAWTLCRAFALAGKEGIPMGHPSSRATSYSKWRGAGRLLVTRKRRTDTDFVT
jgi:hypothetical protein